MKLVLVVAIVSVLCGVGHVNAELLYVTNAYSGTVGVYDSSSGLAVNANLITGLPSFPTGIAVDSSGHLFLTLQSDTVRLYNAADGSLINENFITGLSSAGGITLDGKGHLYVANYTGPGGFFIGVREYNTADGSMVKEIEAEFPADVALDGHGNIFTTDYPYGIVQKFNISDGSTVNPSLISGLHHPVGIAIDGNGHLYISDGTGTVGKYNASDGSVVNANLFTGTTGLVGIELDGHGHAFVANHGNGTIGVYNTSDGTVVNPALITGLSGPEFMAFVTPSAVPEPCSLALAGLGGIGLIVGAIRRRRLTAA